MKLSSSCLILKKGLQTRHFKTVEFEAGNAEYIADSIVEAFEEAGVDINKKLISLSSDGTNVMIGKKSGVHKRLEDKIPGLAFLTSCMDHHLNNSLKKGVEALDPDMEPAFANLYEDLAGAKGRSQKSRREFIKTANDECGIVPEAILKMSGTR